MHREGLTPPPGFRGGGDRGDGSDPELPVASPCTGICRLDDRGAACVGCGRTLGEITGWTAFEAAEKLRVRRMAAARLQAQGGARP